MRPSALERELRELAGAVQWPEPTPGFEAALSARLADAPPPRPAPSPVGRITAWARARARRLFVGGLVLLTAAAVPPVRAQIKDVLGLAGGERVERVGRVPAANAPLDLGRAVSLEKARREAPFEIVLPQRSGNPDEVRRGGDLGAGAVSLRYGAHTVLTELAGTQVIGAVKQIGAGTTLRTVDLVGTQGFWIARGPRVLVLPGLGGEGPRRLRATLPDAGVLLWDRGGVAFRLETRRPFAEAVATARSIDGRR